MRGTVTRRFTWEPALWRCLMHVQLAFLAIDARRDAEVVRRQVRGISRMRGDHRRTASSTSEARTRSTQSSNSSVMSRSGISHSPAGLDTPTPPVVVAPYRSIFSLQVEPADALACLPGGVVELVGGHDPGDLELQAVGVAAVETLGRPVVAGPYECARRVSAVRSRASSSRVSTSQARWYRPTVDRPAPDGRPWADLEQPEVVIVRRSRQPGGRRPREPFRRHVDAAKPRTSR